MTRQQIIRLYLMTSLRKRFWMVIVLAAALGIAAFIISSSLHFSLPVAFLTAFCSVLGIFWSSYRRHLDLGDFPTARDSEVADRSLLRD